MLEFLTRYPEAFGLDISDFSIKFAKLKFSRERYQMSSFGEYELPGDVISQGEVKNKEKLSEYLRKIKEHVQGEPLKTPYVIVSLPEEKAFLEIIQLPMMKEEEVEQAIRFEAENFIPYPIDTVYLDYGIVSPVKNRGEHLDVLVVALQKYLIDSYLEVLKNAQLKPLALELESLALARALVQDYATDAPILLMDLGATRLSVNVFAGRSIRFTSSIPVSSSQFDNSIMNTLKVDKSEALKLKRWQKSVRSAYPSTHGSRRAN